MPRPGYAVTPVLANLPIGVADVGYTLNGGPETVADVLADRGA
jgi:hypothetical protein